MDGVLALTVVDVTCVTDDMPERFVAFLTVGQFDLCVFGTLEEPGDGAEGVRFLGPGPPLGLF
jgi:hypothetical protein